MSSFLTNITNLVTELTPLMDAIADVIPAVVRIILTFAVAALIVGIFGAIVVMVRDMVKGFRGR